MKILYDTDVLLDVLTYRKPFVELSSACLQLSSEGHEGYVCAHTVSNLSYLIGILDHTLKGKKSKHQVIRQRISNLLVHLDVCPVDREAIGMAVSSDISDFEDAITYHVAQRNAIDVIVTRNIKDYPQVESPSVVLPSTCLHLVEKI